MHKTPLPEALVEDLLVGEVESGGAEEVARLGVALLFQGTR